MLTIEQVRSLDEKVRMAVDLIDGLKKENSALRSKLDEYKAKIDQLENVVDSFKLDQMEIEEGIKDVLTQLDMLEDQITAPTPSGNEKAETPQETESRGETSLDETSHDAAPSQPAVDASAVIASAAAETAAESNSAPAESSSTDEEMIPVSASIAVETAEPEIQQPVSENKAPELEIF